MNKPPQLSRVYPTTVASASTAQNIVPTDDDSNTNLNFVTRAIYVGGEAGDIKIKTLNNDLIVLPNIASHFIFPIQALHVYDTGTTATNLIGLA